MEDTQALLQIRDFIVNDFVALRRLPELADHVVKSPVDVFRIKRLIRTGNFEEAALDLLALWHSYGTERVDLLDVLRNLRLNALADNIEAQNLRVTVPRTSSSHARHAGNNDNVPTPVVGVSRPETVVSSGWTRRSEVDNSYVIQESHWVISLARKPDGLYSQHAFLIVEGIQNGVAKIWFMDFVSNGGWQYGTHDGRIRVYPFEKPMAEYPQDARDGLLFSRWQEPEQKMMNPKPSDKMIALLWQVSSDKLLDLIQHVATASKDSRAPKFVITGQGSVFAQSSDFSSPDNKGPRHNCFTWARAQLATLGESTIRSRLEDKDEFSWFINITSRVLVDDRPRTRQSQINTVLVGIIVAMIAVYFASLRQ